MPVIKRYPNRKLYDTDAKRYITLDGIAALIRSGEDVVVIDHQTEEDLTAVTLTQIIFEQEKKKGGFLPTSVLTGLVQSGGSTLNSLRRSLSSPLDLLHGFDDEIERRLQILVKQGEMAREEALRLRDKLLSIGSRGPAETAAEEDEDGELADALARHDVPTRSEVDQLNAQLEQLSAQLDNIIAARRAAEDQNDTEA